MPRPRALLGLLAWVLTACGAAPTTVESPASAPPARCETGGDFSAPNDQGALVDIPDPASRATIVDLWARWCKGCNTAVANLLAHRDELEADGIRIVLLGVLEEGESIDDARATLTSWSVREPFMIDRGGTLMRKYGFADLPATVVLDAKGNVRWTSTKDSTADDAVAAAHEAATAACR